MTFQLCHPADRGAPLSVRVNSLVASVKPPTPFPPHVEATGDDTF